MLEVAVAVLLSVAAPAPPVLDSAQELERTARASARRYERLLRTLAPETLGSPRGQRCDEHVGRFCFWYGSPGQPRPPVPPEDVRIAEARDVAIREHRRWFGASPADHRAGGPLVRYLVEAGRVSEAVSAARAHAWAAGGTPASLLIVGLALHSAGAAAEAEAVFDSARALLPDASRRRLDDVGVLLATAELRRYRSLDEAARAAYEARFWAFSDPSPMTPGNERRSAHYARHALSGIMAEAPRVEGMLRWGRDHEELLLRYGVPASRQRYRNNRPMALETGVTLLERYHPYSVSFTPAALLAEGLPFPPAPGVRPELERDTVRSRHVPVLTPRTRGLDVQVSVFPHADLPVLRVDAALRPDTVDPAVPAAPAGLLLVLDTLGTEVTRVPARVRMLHDSVTLLTAEAPVPPGAYVFAVQLRCEETGLAGLARYRVDVPAAAGLTLSDLLLTEPVPGDGAPDRADPAVTPIPRLVVEPTRVLGVHAELSGLAVGDRAGHFEVESWIERVDDASLLGRAARWMGERLGLVRTEPPTRLRWADAAPSGVHPLYFDVDLADIAPGLYRLGLTVRDGATGAERTALRLVRVSDGPGRR